MQLFDCQNCGQLLFFENTHCGNCGHALGYSVEHSRLLTLQAADSGGWLALGLSESTWRYCANADAIGCNWLLPAQSDQSFCVACALNNTIPDLSKPENTERWRRLEQAKRRLIYSLLRLGLPIISKSEDPVQGLAFDFLEDAPPSAGGDRVFTGHDNGVITINILEADDAERELLRKNLAEPYRTLLGHFRHEIGHYYWDILVSPSKWLTPFRQLFGDESRDYAAALEDHYAAAPDGEWQRSYVSAYASSHPWEDWAETWAHYLHMIDALETAYAYGLQVLPKAGPQALLSAEADIDPYRLPDFDELLERWLPLTMAINSLNRSMGHGDFYPFVLPPPTQEKLKFIHALIHSVAPSSRESLAASAPEGGAL